MSSDSQVSPKAPVSEDQSASDGHGAAGSKSDSTATPNERDAAEAENSSLVSPKQSGAKSEEFHAASPEEPVAARPGNSVEPASIVGPIFWLKLGTKMYEDSPKLLREQAKNLATGIGWFWTIYTALVLYRAGPLGRLDIPAKLFILAPVLLLLAAYLLALSSGLPLKLDSTPVLRSRCVRSILVCCASDTAP